MSARGAGAVIALSCVFATQVMAESPALPDGEATYLEQCVACHGVEGKGDGPAGLTATTTPRDFTVGRFKFDADGDGRAGTDEDLFLVIRNGAAVVGGNPLMVAWGGLGDDRVRELVRYVRSLEE